LPRDDPSDDPGDDAADDPGAPCIAAPKAPVAFALSTAGGWLWGGAAFVP